MIAPAFFLALPVVLVIVVIWWLLRERALLRDVLDLPAPASATVPPAHGSTPTPTSGSGRGRGGQGVRVAERQERAARAALRTADRCVDVAPLRCPLEVSE